MSSLINPYRKAELHKRQSSGRGKPMNARIGLYMTFLLALPLSAMAQKKDSAAPIAWVQVLPRGTAVRATTTSARCPNIRFNDRAVPMTERAAPDVDFQIR